VSCDQCLRAGVECVYIGKLSCSRCTNLIKKQCERGGQRLRPKIPRGSKLPEEKTEGKKRVPRQVVVVDSSDSADEKEQEERGVELKTIEKERGEQRAEPKAIEKVSTVPEQSGGSKVELRTALVEKEVGDRFGNLQVPGLGAYYADQTPTDRMTVTKDAIAMVRVLRQCLNYGFDRFLAESGVELNDLQNIPNWRETVRAVDPSERDPTETGVLDREFSSNPSISRGTEGESSKRPRQASRSKPKKKLRINSPIREEEEEEEEEEEGVNTLT
jgi:hypothetical protein